MIRHFEEDSDEEDVDNHTPAIKQNAASNQDVKKSSSNSISSLAGYSKSAEEMRPSTFDERLRRKLAAGATT